MVVADSDGGTGLMHGKLVVEEGGNNQMDVEPSMASCSREETFECNQCTETFPDRDTLFKHVKLAHQQHVHDRRRFKCEQCQRTFKSMTGLRNHARTHSLFFEVNADRRQSISNLSELSNTSAECTMDSTFVVETDTSFVSCIIDNINSNENVQMNGGENISTRDAPNTISAGSEKSRRRRSGIPVPLRRSLSSPDQNLLTSELKADHECSNEPNDNIQTDRTEQSKYKRNPANSIKISSNRASRRMTRVISCDINSAVNQNEQRRHLSQSRTFKSSSSQTPEPKTVNSPQLHHKSPFGSKYRTKLSSPVTPKGRSRSNKGTPGKSKRTPNSRTPSKGASAPASRVGSSTPVNSQRTGCRGANTPTGKGFNCKKCGKSFLDSAKLEVHFAVHIRDTPEKCGIPKHAIKKTPNTKKTICTREQEPRSKVDESFSCTLCGRSYAVKKYLDAHMKIHDVDTPYSCDFCDKKFRYMSSLRAHSFVHAGESRGTESKNNKESLSAPKELSRDSNNGQATTKFNIFSILSSSGQTFDDLMNEPPFSCKMCNFKTRGPSELLTHMKTHSNTGRYTCAYCPKSYKSQTNLKIHEKTHTIGRLKQILIEGRNSRTAQL